MITSQDMNRVLRATDQLLAKEENWNQGIMYTALYNSDGSITRKYCLYGAFQSCICGEPKKGEIERELLRLMKIYSGNPSIIFFNDSEDRKFSEIKAFLQWAILRIME